MRRLVAAALVLAISPSLSAGVTYGIESSGSGFASATISGIVKADRGKMRIDVTRGDGLLFTAGSVVLGKGTGPITVADPDQKSYFEIDPANLLGTGGPTSPLQGLVNIDARNPRVSVRDLGSGGTVEGYATQRSVIDSSYQIVMDMFGQTTSSTIRSRSEVWWTSAIPAEYANVFQTTALHTGIAAIDKILAAQTSTIKGFPLKQVTTTTVTVNGKDQVSTSTTHVTNVKETAIPAAEFALPAGYRKTDSPLDALLKNLRP